MIIIDNRRFIYTRADGKSICVGCKYTDDYKGCLIGANDSTVKFSASCSQYNGLVPYKRSVSIYVGDREIELDLDDFKELKIKYN